MNPVPDLDRWSGRVTAYSKSPFPIVLFPAYLLDNDVAKNGNVFLLHFKTINVYATFSKLSTFKHGDNDQKSCIMYETCRVEMTRRLSECRMLLCVQDVFYCV